MLHGEGYAAHAWQYLQCVYRILFFWKLVRLVVLEALMGQQFNLTP